MDGRMADGWRRKDGDSGQREKRRSSARQRERRTHTETPSVFHFCCHNHRRRAPPTNPRVFFLSCSGRSVGRVGSRIQVGRFSLGLGAWSMGRQAGIIAIFVIPPILPKRCVCVCVCLIMCTYSSVPFPSFVFGLGSRGCCSL
ncbi:hypothetical protein B0T18DRAFT_9905 [Schizothecium vesticola]|uniref:Uncharacterized protein n=1 Tax=Schizothecium vesticola TaxID=314040 RepID=A0AA40F8M3_9PEZI|nr:hypothetical protein B0T18DRAFT_9905 [Schizothecium vesticola]